MKKITLTLLAVMCTLLSVSANNNILGLFNVGARIGIISSSESIPMNEDQLKESITAEGTGWTGTVFARINLPKLPLYIQPELQYTNTTIKIPSINDLLPGEKAPEPESHKYIDLPILLGAEFGLGSLASVRINAGPVFAITSEKGFGDLTEEDFIHAYQEPKATWTAGLGVKVLSLIAEIRYNGSFNSGEIKADNLADSINTNRTSWNLSIGVMF